ncbi:MULTISPECIES: hypothetical protein [Cysteiniphilum]|uniref:hypothetical protein n=1 Tax=Cysteiniphilum TaxID=2056696 RepID=UPI00177E22A9|nr:MULTISPECIES: hypothetical protein [Cysteiniphilum]
MTINKNKAFYFIPKYQAATLIYDNIVKYQPQLDHLKKALERCPETYQTESQKIPDKVAWLHYYHPTGWHWYVIEKDICDEQLQVFALVSGHDTEFGYFSIHELREIAGVLIDLNWKPKPLSDINEISHFVATFINEVEVDNSEIK